jgi:hypothetical protein
VPANRFDEVAHPKFGKAGLVGGVDRVTDCVLKAGEVEVESRDVIKRGVPTLFFTLIRSPGLELMEFLGRNDVVRPENDGVADADGQF